MSDTARRRPPTSKELERVCKAWNDANRVGADVELVLDNGKSVMTQTKSHAYVMSGHSAVIFLACKSGCYSLSRVGPLCL